MSDIFTYDTVQAGLVLLLFMVFGDWISKKLKGRVPSFLIAGLSFMLISWTGILPEDLGDIAAITPMVSLCTALLIASAGTSMSFRTFAENWRVVAHSMLCYIIQAFLTLLCIGIFYGFNLAVGGLPGGSMTCVIIREKALALGCDDTIVLSVLNFSTRAMVAALMCGPYVEKEAGRLLTLENAGSGSSSSHAPKARKIGFFDASGYGNLMKLFILGFISEKVGALTGINMYILCLIFGVAAANVGFADGSTMSGSGSERFFYYMLIGSLLCGFAKATPQMFLYMMIPLLMIILTGILSTMVISPFVGRIFGFSKDMSIILASNIMMGFPVNMFIAKETAERMTEDPEKRQLIENDLGTKMLIAGLSTTTTLAVVAGGIMVRFMK